MDGTHWGSCPDPQIHGLWVIGAGLKFQSESIEPEPINLMLSWVDPLVILIFFSLIYWYSSIFQISTVDHNL
jgi:hypothetical protein